MITMTVKLSPTTSARLAAEAKARRVSKSQILREMAEERYSSSRRKKNKKPFISVYDLVADIVGKGTGGPPDLSTNPKYMEGFGE